MEDNYSLQNCKDDDIVGFGNSIFKIGQFRKAINKSFGTSIGNQLNYELISQKIEMNLSSYPGGQANACAILFSDGLPCEILNLGSPNWKKGKMKIKVTVEFYAEEDNVEVSNNQANINQPESPLDDLRRMINQESDK